jgi:hypothetical protein
MEPEAKKDCAAEDKQQFTGQFELEHSEGSYCDRTVKYGRESRGTRSQESMCWWGQQQISSQSVS